MLAYAICGSFCNHANAIEQLKNLKELGYDILPVLSENAASLDTRFGLHDDLIKNTENICGKKAIRTIVDAEELSSKKAVDCVIVSPCTGNTLAKLANGITDSTITMAVKAHLRNRKPVLLALATNDALSANFKNIAALYEKKHVFFVPIKQDDAMKKATSVICDFNLLPDALYFALQGLQMQPFLL
ncbi:MAG: dipicolinate synthase subunit B [Clostridiales bacterium GWF2_38_85]|nr:MAG: dipicolinate synthase subunit B [Clostridiales bacterium GWF2_38_85]